MLKKALLSSILFLAFHQAVYACRCPLPPEDVPLPQSVEEFAKRQLSQADAVFFGKVIEIEEYNSQYLSYKIKLKVVTAWRLVETKEIVIYARKDTGDNCGVDLKIGESYVIYAQKSRDDRFYPIDELYTDACLWGSQDQKFLGKGYKPKKKSNN
jgi:hypothetical protein